MLSSLLACVLCMRDISPRFWLIPGLLLPAWSSSPEVIIRDIKLIKHVSGDRGCVRQ